MNKQKKKILILGGGFAGVYAYLHLVKHDKRCDCIEVTAINKDDHFSFVVLAHEVATGGLLPSNTTQSIQELPQNNDTDFMQAEILSVNFDTQTVDIQRRDTLCAGKNETCHLDTLSYDYLLMGLGSENFSFGVPGVYEYTLPLKSINDAKKIKNRILESFEAAQYCANDSYVRELLTFTIIGGGPTGVEIAGEMADLVYGVLGKIYPQLIDRCEILLIQSGDRLMPQVHEWFHKKALDILERKKVRVLFGEKVTEIQADKILLGEKVLKTRNAFWTAGVIARQIPIISEKKFEIDERSRRIKVNTEMQIPQYENVYVAGDQSWIVDTETGQPYPMRAQFAVRQAIVAAHNMIAHIHSGKIINFKWKDQGFIVSLGRGGALAEIFGFRFSGLFAWWLYRTAYLFKLVGIKAKLRTGLEWAISLVFSRDISKL